jgi:Domain of unknown function (DUF1877)
VITPLQDDAAIGDFSEAETARIAQALTQITDADLMARSAGATMLAADIYSQISDDEEDGRSYLLDFVRPLKSCIAQAHGEGLGWVIALQSPAPTPP